MKKLMTFVVAFAFLFASSAVFAESTMVGPKPEMKIEKVDKTKKVKKGNKAEVKKAEAKKVEGKKAEKAAPVAPAAKK